MAEKRIEDVINEVLTGDSQKNALDFAAFLRANEMTIEGGEGNCWNVDYKEKDVGVLYVSGDAERPGPWTFWSNDDDYNAPAGFAIDEQTKEIAWEHANYCGKCGAKCAPVRPKTIFGKKFEEMCVSTLMFTDPSVESLAGLKKLVEIRKYVIQNEE
ncbi:MAG: hypothetical protein FWE04_00840 [Oscillospiraceae bacterium]|nr:hypothetical protein [Oscillospiraceae bacterium]